MLQYYWIKSNNDTKQGSIIEKLNWRRKKKYAMAFKYAMTIRDQSVKCQVRLSVVEFQQ